jgi:hypothetical protein
LALAANCQNIRLPLIKTTELGKKVGFVTGTLSQFPLVLQTNEFHRKQIAKSFACSISRFILPIFSKMASGPMRQCCVTGFKHEGTPVGKIEKNFVETKLGPVEAYISEPTAAKDKEAKRAILLSVARRDRKRTPD